MQNVKGSWMGWAMCRHDVVIPDREEVDVEVKKDSVAMVFCWSLAEKELRTEPLVFKNRRSPGRAADLLTATLLTC